MITKRPQPQLIPFPVLSGNDREHPPGLLVLIFAVASPAFFNFDFGFEFELLPLPVELQVAVEVMVELSGEAAAVIKVH